MTAIGIDLGTTNSLIAVFDDDGARLIPNAVGSPLTPSAISVLDNGEIVVGVAARDRLVSHPMVSTSQFKRLIGTDKVTKLGKHKFRAEELSALVLRSLVADAEAALGEKVESAVISVPAYFDSLKRNATVAAGEMAGLKVERLINEPTAAALAYGLHDKDDESLFITLDLGGGTFDVSLLEMFEGVVEVRATAGDAFLGGEDFTDVLAGELARMLDAEYDKLKLDERARVRAAAERAKLELSKSHEVAIAFPFRGQRVEPKISRDAFETAVSGLMARLRRPIERCLYDADLDVGALDRVVLVGGATRMPVIRSMVGRLFGRLPEQRLDPDHVVALGAAAQAALIAKHAGLKETVMTDVAPFTLGVDVIHQVGRQVVQDVFEPIIERNTPIPASREKIFTTARDGQRKLKFNILQGESARASENVKLGEVEIAIPAGKAGEHSAAARLTYDPSGIIDVDVRSLSTDKSINLVIERNPGALSKADIDKKLKALEKLKIHPRDQAENQQLTARLNRLFEMTLGDDRQFVAELLARFEASMAQQDPGEVANAREEIAEIADRIEAAYGS